MKNFIWYEKYREKSLARLVLPQKHKKFFRRCLRTKEIPHLLFVGPFGSGKTTLALILIKKCASSKLILNASSYDRGIGIVKTKVKDFASSATLHEKKTNIIFFDEADGLTPDAQEALKNTIETHQRNCRFIFTANQIERIHGAIISRCQLWEFKSLGFSNVLALGCRVLEKEGIKYNKDDVKKITKIGYPDIRSILNLLQQNSSTGKLVFSSIVWKDKEVLQSYIKSGHINAARNMWKGSTDFLWLYKWLFDHFINKVKPSVQARVAISVAEYLYRDRFVADKEINAAACLLEIMGILNVKIDFDVPF